MKMPWQLRAKRATTKVSFVMEFASRYLKIDFAIVAWTPFV
jgi:ribosomal protein L31E